MTKRKTVLLLAALAMLAISCSLTNGATSGAAILAKPLGTPTAAQIDQPIQPAQTPTPAPQRCTVKAHALNLRACGGTDCGVIFVLDEGDRLIVLAAGDWLNVQTEAGAAGFVNSNYCEIGE